ncbi:hypothetical protein M513_07150 [Trichuris suis]|uniref:Cytochrome oxidase c subunit VIb n=1 Tax=Trichuris suis TaxID=68888 RepID=A0A085M472_9BILA|nr:hypothetical protein M513_07150 [Trichuris suis]
MKSAMSKSDKTDKIDKNADRKAWMNNWSDVLNGELAYPIDSKMLFDKEANEAEIRKLKPKPLDLRFTQRTRTKACFTYYVNYHRCMNLKSEKDKEDCELFKALYRDNCPKDIVEKWDEWIAEDRFPANLKY